MQAPEYSLLVPKAPILDDSSGIVDEFLASCFNNPEDRWRKDVLQEVLNSSFLQEQTLEPVDQGVDDPYTKGHGKMNVSIYSVFLEGSSKQGWRCLLGSEKWPCKTKVTFKRFQRAVEHIRSHLNHRPYKCGAQCGILNCQRSFFAEQYLRDHTNNNSSCKYCNQAMRSSQLPRHYLFCRAKEGKADNPTEK
ncbi:hypothetical protein CPB86DRAFT_325657 [Serendipita vermifera]|nr:hypothetical protein CPB86DRAFT_325657 [Serendipita vermifera]